jgi:cytochrome c oxidase subunit II
MIERLLPLAGSAHAPDFDAVLSAVHTHIAIQALAWGAFFIYCLVRFRASRQPVPSSRPLRPTLPLLAIALVVIGDALLLATTALPVWWRRAALPDPSTRPFEVRVIAEQFAWHVHYPGPDGTFGISAPALISASNPVGIDRRDDAARDDIGLTNILTVPVGRPVIVQLTSRDVVHSFTLNEMRVKQDATPGLTVRTWFVPTTIGNWEIACSQLCGLGHYRMRGTFRVMSDEDWDAWQARELALVTRAPR